jgi:hypothetical protein
MIVTMNSKEVLKRRAEARFRQEERAGRKAMTEYGSSGSRHSRKDRTFEGTSISSGSPGAERRAAAENKSSAAQEPQQLITAL